MQFSSKLSLLLNIFEVKNLDLANELDIDRTLISKWRSGQRKPSSDSQQMVQLSKYFANLLHKEENAKFFKSAFGLEDNLVFPNNDELCKPLMDWFCDDRKNMNDLIHGVFLHSKKQNIISNNDLLPSPILYYEGYNGYVEACNFLKSYLIDGGKSKKIKFGMDYRMHMYLIGMKKSPILNNTVLNLNNTILSYAINHGHPVEMIMNVSDHNLSYCIETFAAFLTTDNYKYVSFNCYDKSTPAPNHFIIIEDEIIEYGSFSDNTAFAPIIAHVTTNKSIINAFSQAYDNIFRFTRPVNLAKYVK